jgi:C4-dicarboxylate-binding protein DctP
MLRHYLSGKGTIAMHVQSLLRGLIAAGAFFSATAAITMAHASTALRIAVDTTPTHVRNQALAKFAATVKAKTNGEIEPQIFHSGQLYKDGQTPQALQQGAIDMAVPGSWVLGGLEKRWSLLGLPYFVGRSAIEMQRVADGPVGKELAEATAEKLNAVVLGRWLDLGPGHTFLGQKASVGFKTWKDFAGLKIRYPGGAYMAVRFKHFGATPVLVPFTDVPLGLLRGNFDGLLSTADSVADIKLWDSGLKLAYVDFGNFAQYVPFVSKAFWNKITPAQRDVIRAAWEEIVPESRANVERVQEEAIATLAKNGVGVIRPSVEERAQMREFQMAVQDQLIGELGLDPAWVKDALSRIAAGK